MIRRRFSTGESEFNPDKYLTIEALEDGLQISHANGFEYKTTNNKWQRANQNELTTEINKGEFLYIRANWITSNHKSFNITRSCNLRGNCLSLLFENNADKQHNISKFPYAFSSLFNSCPIKEVVSDFLPATTLASGCYYYMFNNCTSLTTAPELPATTLTQYCYSHMFHDCTSLTTAPELPATTLASSCYYYMFYGCTKLSYIKMLATDISASSCLNDWVYNVAPRGIFIKHSDKTLPTGSSGIPSGWTVVNDGEESGNLITFTVSDTEYQAEEGMTWEEFVNSEYNTSGYFTSTSYDLVIYKGNTLIIGDLNNHSDVNITDLIVENGSYMVYSSSAD